MSPCTHLSRDLGDPGQQGLLSASAWHLDMLTAHAVRPGHPGWTGALGFPSAGPPSLAGAPTDDIQCEGAAILAHRLPVR